MLKVGDKLPDFEGLNQEGEVIKSSDFLGKKLVVFFYPKANTPGCTAEACDLSDNYLTFQARGFQILGISADEVKRQKKFHTKYDFPYPLLADTEKEVIKAFGVWQPKKFMGREFLGILRTTFVFDEQGTCTEVIDKVKTKEHSSQILK